jgi:hypothetical protein
MSTFPFSTTDSSEEWEVYPDEVKGKKGAFDYQVNERQIGDFLKDEYPHFSAKRCLAIVNEVMRRVSSPTFQKNPVGYLKVLKEKRGGEDSLHILIDPTIEFLSYFTRSFSDLSSGDIE